MPHYNPDLHHRRSIRLKGYDYSQEGLYFITICVQEHKCVFGHIAAGEMILSNYGQVAKDCWQAIPQHYPHVVLHEFVIMPNHLHGIIEITQGVGAELKIGDSQYFPPCNDDKNNRTNNNRVENIRPLRAEIADNRVENIPPPPRPNCESGTIGAIVRGFKIGVTKQIGYSVWQRNYHEHIIRDRNRHAIIVDYINNNPARWEGDMFYVH
jgi:REP element-mobilizing transposase RayT